MEEAIYKLKKGKEIKEYSRHRRDTYNDNQ